jgi:hypothetical protein
VGTVRQCFRNPWNLLPEMQCVRSPLRLSILWPCADAKRLHAMVCQRRRSQAQSASLQARCWHRHTLAPVPRHVNAPWRQISLARQGNVSKVHLPGQRQGNISLPCQGNLSPRCIYMAWDWRQGVPVPATSLQTCRLGLRSSSLADHSKQTLCVGARPQDRLTEGRTDALHLGQQVPWVAEALAHSAHDLALLQAAVVWVDLRHGLRVGHQRVPGHVAIAGGCAGHTSLGRNGEISVRSVANGAMAISVSRAGSESTPAPNRGAPAWEGMPPSKSLSLATRMSRASACFFENTLSPKARDSSRSNRAREVRRRARRAPPPARMPMNPMSSHLDVLPPADCAGKIDPSLSSTSQVQPS